MQSHRLSRFPELARIVSSSSDYGEFRTRFEAAAESATASDLVELREIGSNAFQAFLEAFERPDMDLLKWFAVQCDSDRIVETETIRRLLLKLQRSAQRESDRRRYGAFDAATNILQTKRVVQLSWFGFAGFRASDAFEVRRSIYSSRQEREFSNAARLRFPGLVVIPNYPLRQIVDMDKLKQILPDEVVRYGFGCLIDTVLVTPHEGDPIAAFELDSRFHDNLTKQQQDRWKEELLKTANIAFFRLRSEDPAATSIDEWYSLLTDEVVERIDCGTRIRTRDVHATLVPIIR